VLTEFVGVRWSSVEKRAPVVVLTYRLIFFIKHSPTPSNFLNKLILMVKNTRYNRYYTYLLYNILYTRPFERAHVENGLGVRVCNLKKLNSKETFEKCIITAYRVYKRYYKFLYGATIITIIQAITIIYNIYKYIASDF